MDTNRVPQPRHDDDSVEGTTPASSAPTPAWTSGCSLAALSSPSTTLMARSSSTSAWRAAAARIADSPRSHNLRPHPTTLPGVLGRLDEGCAALEKWPPGIQRYVIWKMRPASF